MLSKRYVLSMLDDPAPRWTQVAPKTSQNCPKMASTWPEISPRETQVATKSSQDTFKMASTRPRVHILQHITYNVHLISLARRNAR